MQKGKSVILVSNMCFNDAVNLCLQKPDIIKYYNQMKSVVDTVDQMIETHNGARSTKRWPMVIFTQFLILQK